MHGLYKLFYNMCCNSDKLAYKSKKSINGKYNKVKTFMRIF